MKRLIPAAVLSVALVFSVPQAKSQRSLQQSSFQMEGKTYTITQYPGTGVHMVMLSGPAGNAMVQVDGDKITAYISPPGGGAYKAVIDKVWNGYLASKGGATARDSSASGSSGAGLTVDGVVAMLQAGISSDLVITKIQQSGQTFNLSTDDMIRLKKAGASDAVMKTMMTSTPSPSVGPSPMPAASAAAAPPADVAPNAVAENPNMGKLKKEGFFASIGHGVSNAAHGRSVIDQLSMRNILPQWDPNQKISAQYPHIAITVLSAPMGWTDDYRVMVQKNNNNKLVQSCFKLKAVVWLDATRSKPTDEFQWCVEQDMFMSELQPTYLYSLAETKAEYGQTTGINRTDGPQPPDKLLPNDRATLDMEAKTNPQGASKDLNLDSNSLFAIMFANVRKDLGETLGSDGDYRVWITSIKKAAGPSLF